MNSLYSSFVTLSTLSCNLQQQRKKEDSTSDSYTECNHNEQQHSQEH